MCHFEITAGAPYARPHPDTTTTLYIFMSFAFPKIHSFPPFYTRQLHEETWQKQRDLWIEMILAYCGGKRMFEINLGEESVYGMELFFNTEIDRKKCKLSSKHNIPLPLTLPILTIPNVQTEITI